MSPPPYVKQDWKNDETYADEAHLDHMEEGIYQNSLDIASIPVGPAGADADITYNGDYPAGSPYKDGDIVVMDGVPYLCVRPTSAAPTPWAPMGTPVFVMTQAEFNALAPPDPDSLYVIIG